MTQADFRKELKSGLSGTYLFYGDEEYLKKFYAGRAQVHTVGDDPDLASWNTHIISADADAALGELEAATLSVSMMGDRSFVRYNADLTSLTEEETELLFDIIRGVDPDSTVLLIVAPPGGFDPGTAKKPSKMFKKYEAVAKLVDLTAQSPAELRKWIARRLSQDSLEMTPDAQDTLVRRCTDNMFILSGELDKLSAYCLANNISVIGTDTVLEISSVTAEEDAFALANAILEGDRRRALSVLHIHKMHRESAVMVLASVTRCICDMMTVAYLAHEGADKQTVAREMKMHEYRAGLYLAAVAGSPPERLLAAAKRCREADLKLKSTSLDYIALERLICTIPAKRRAR
ncbi:MAG: DNA polymerase III subunit delta [Clostridia bacterium]|nr:DNA polymerase III subunit delta [Clostridia bacterium]